MFPHDTLGHSLGYGSVSVSVNLLYVILLKQILQGKGLLGNAKKSSVSISFTFLSFGWLLMMTLPKSCSVYQPRKFFLNTQKKYTKVSEQIQDTLKR